MFSITPYVGPPISVPIPICYRNLHGDILPDTIMQ
jgi:hypothetical protein